MKTLEEITKGIPLERLEEICKAEKDGKCVILPCRVGDAIDKMFSHNEIIALWYDKPNDKQYSYKLWEGEAWRLPRKYKDLRLIKAFGTIPEKINKADTINLLTTPFIVPAYKKPETKVGENAKQEAEKALKERSK